MVASDRIADALHGSWNLTEDDPKATHEECIANGSYRGGEHFGLLHIRGCSTPVCGQSKFSEQKMTEADLNVGLSKS